MKELERKIVAILKNKDKFCNIKLAKGIFMDNVPTYNRFENKQSTYGVGVSTIKFGQKWFTLPKGDAIFKTYDTFAEQLKNVRIINELVCQEICKQIGLGCAEYEQATLGTKTGVVSYNVAKENEMLIDGEMLKNISNVTEKSCSMTVYMKAIDNLKKQNININKRSMTNELYKMLIFDILTFQTDRHDRNIFFVANNYENSLKPTKVIDNEFAFLTLLLPQIQYAKDFDSILDTYVDYVKFNKKIFSIDNFKSYKKLVSSAVNLARTDNELKEILINTLKSIDIEKAIKNVESIGNEINTEYKEYMELLVDYSKQTFKEEIKSYKKSFNDNEKEK